MGKKNKKKEKKKGKKKRGTEGAPVPDPAATTAAESRPKENAHPRGWCCPDCESPLHEDYDDETDGALYVCQRCLALVSTEGGKLRLLDYHKELSVTERCLFISGVTMALMNQAMGELANKAKDSELN